MSKCAQRLRNIARCVDPHNDGPKRAWGFAVKFGNEIGQGVDAGEIVDGKLVEIVQRNRRDRSPDFPDSIHNAIFIEAAHRWLPDDRTYRIRGQSIGDTSAAELYADAALAIADAIEAAAPTAAVRTAPGIEVDAENQTVTYNGRLCRFGGVQCWDSFHDLWKNLGGRSVPIENASELRRTLRKAGLPELADAVKSHTGVGYWLVRQR